MDDFDYIRASTIEEVVSLLSTKDENTHILSGGTDLLVQLKEGRRKARLLVDIKSVPDLNEIHYDPVAGLHLGAAASCLRVCSHADIIQRYPGLIDAVSLIGGTQIQGRASVGGNLCNASPAADSIPALIVHQASCLIFGPEGKRAVPVENFCIAPGKTILQRGEFLVALRLPPPALRFGASYLRFIPRNDMDIAVAGAGASVTLDEHQSTFISVRIALAAVAPTPLFVPGAGDVLIGRKISTESIAEAARIASESAQPISDLRGATTQRKHLVAVLTRRALSKAIERAKT